MLFPADAISFFEDMFSPLPFFAWDSDFVLPCPNPPFLKEFRKSEQKIALKEETRCVAEYHR